MRAEGRLRRLISRQARYSQCNGFLHDGSLSLASSRSSGRGWRQGGQRPAPGPLLGIVSWIRQVLRAGTAPPLCLATSRGH